MSRVERLADLLSSNRLAATRLADATGVLLDTDSLQVLAVNETGQALVEAVQQGASTEEELVASLLAGFEVDEATARAHVDDFLTDLLARVPNGDD